MNYEQLTWIVTWVRSRYDDMTSLLMNLRRPSSVRRLRIVTSFGSSPIKRARLLTREKSRFESKRIVILPSTAKKKVFLYVIKCLIGLTVPNETRTIKNLDGQSKLQIKSNLDFHFFKSSFPFFHKLNWNTKDEHFDTVSKFYFFTILHLWSMWTHKTIRIMLRTRGRAVLRLSGALGKCLPCLWVKTALTRGNPITEIRPLKRL